MKDEHTCPNCGWVLSREPQPNKLRSALQTGDLTATEPNVVPLADRIDHISENPSRNKEERRHKRIRGEFKACIRVGTREEIVTAKDLSRRGVRFTTSTVYTIGTMVKVAAPYTLDGDNIYLSGRVVREHRRPTRYIPGEYGLEILI
jgi:hypothetical protein